MFAIPRNVITFAPSGRRVPAPDPMPIRAVRVPDDLWEQAKRVAADRDESVAEVIRRALERYVRSHPVGED